MCEKTYTARDLNEFGDILSKAQGFIKSMWCGDSRCEEKIKAAFQATSRVMPFEQETISDKCVCCSEKADTMVYWARAY